MTTIKDQPVYDISTAPHPTFKNWPWWHYVALGVGVTIVAPLTFIGAGTVGHWAFDPQPTAAAKTITLGQPAKPHKTPKPAPTYNLPAYQAAISGPEYQAFVTALAKFRADSRKYDFTAVSSDSLALTNAANVWLNLIKDSSPPPSYQAQKLTYILAITLAQKAATETQSGISSANLGSLQAGMRLANKARATLARAAVSGPTGS
jgi:hypothetical protein